jgi:hypothetical protein
MEFIISAFLVSVISAGLFMSFNIGQRSSMLTSPKVDLQAKVRQVLDIICRDVRQTISWEIADANNNASDSHIKFRLVQGWDKDTSNISFKKEEDDTDYYYYVEYTYSAGAQTITRTQTKVRVSDLAVISTSTRTFSNITAVPFYTRNTSGTKVALNQADLLTSRRMVIVVMGTTQVRGLTYQLSLEEEVKVRNE